MQALGSACGNEYGLACEHGHSCCILLARRSRFFRDGSWHTWIDYERFQVCPFAERAGEPAGNSLCTHVEWLLQLGMQISKRAPVCSFNCAAFDSGGLS